MCKNKATVGVERLTSFSKLAESCLFLCEVSMDWKDKEQVREYKRLHQINWRIENREKYLQQKREWYKNNQEKIKIYRDNNKERKAEWHRKNKQAIRKSRYKYIKNNKEKVFISKKKYMETNPWRKHYSSAQQRCTNHKHIAFSRYGGRGIKFLLTMEEIKRLWFRDKASGMKCATIDRINNDGNYEFNNCQFIERSENVKKRWVERKLQKGEDVDITNEISAAVAVVIDDINVYDE